MNLHKRIGLILFLLIGGVCFGGGLVGKEAPDITIRQWVTEKPPAINILVGKVRVLEFWATWCHPCVENIPHLIALNDKYKAKGLEFIALSQDRSTDEVSKFVKKKKMNYNVAMDNGTTDLYGIKGYPTAVIINHMGKVVWMGHPADDKFEKAISKALSACPVPVPPIVAGVDLGPFTKYEKRFWGGKDFHETYRQIESNISKNKETRDSIIARRIIETIDSRITQEINKADRLRAKDPARAYMIYAEIVDKYDGIEISAPAKAAYLELKRNSQSEK